jgi:hypothetical protein
MHVTHKSEVLDSTLNSPRSKSLHNSTQGHTIAQNPFYKRKTSSATISLLSPPFYEPSLHRTVTRGEKEDVIYLLFVGYTFSSRLEQVVADAFN